MKRVQQIIDASKKHRRKVAILGRSMVNIVNTAINLGYMRIPENILEQAVITMVGRDLRPKTPGAKALEECVRDMKGLTWELKKKRREILQKLTVRDIMESAAALESASEKAALVTIAGRQAVKKEKSFIKEKGFKITDLSI